MATAAVVCSSCGGRLSRADQVCPNCGSALSWADEQKSEPGAAAVHCDVCGHENPAGVEYCRSCGARLTAAPAAKLHPREPRRAEDRVARKARAAPGKKFEPWQILSLAALIVLAAFLVYNEATKQQSLLPAGSPTGFPSAQPTRAVDLAPLESAVRTRPDDPEALVHLANALQDQGAYPRAIETYTRYLAIRPADPDARVDMGSCFYQMALLDTANAAKYFARALEEMGQAHRDNPAHQPAVFNMGVVNLQMGNLEESNRWFRDAVKINPNSDLGRRAQQMITQHSFPQ